MTNRGLSVLSSCLTSESHTYDFAVMHTRGAMTPSHPPRFGGLKAVVHALIDGHATAPMVGLPDLLPSCSQFPTFDSREITHVVPCCVPALPSEVFLLKHCPDSSNKSLRRLLCVSASRFWRLRLSQRMLATGKEYKRRAQDLQIFVTSHMSFLILSTSSSCHFEASVETREAMFN